MPEWFEDWFNSKYYHILYGHRDDLEAHAFITNLSRELNLSPGDHVLDLGCGKGRHARFFNSLGYKVVGADLSCDSIASAREHENETLSFVVHDMRHKLVMRNFDLVVNLFTSFGYFESQTDNLNLLKSVHEYLNAGGRLVIDFLNSEKIINQLVPEEVKRCDGIDFFIERKIESGFIIKTIQFTDNNENFKFLEKVQLLTLTDFEELFLKSGFRILSVFGDYNLGKFEPKNSDRLILIAEKI